jgi:hydrogenase maturation factor
MHDATEGGIFGASYEMAELSGIGLLIEEDKIPVQPVTRRIVETLDLDVMRLISSGSLLIATSEPEKLIKVFSENDISCSAIGTFTNVGFFTKDIHGNMTPLLPPDVDDLYKLL